MASQNATDYPRVLVISPHSFNLTDGGGIALTNYFHGWPADRIAQAHVFDAGMPADTSVCRTFYHLSGRELLPAPPILLYRAVKKWLFGRRRSPDTAIASGQMDAGPSPHLAKPEIDERNSGLRLRLERVLVRHGFFSGVESQISPEFDKFVRDFGPEAVFAVPGDIAFAKLPRQVSERYDLPLAVQLADDWMTHYPTKHVVARATAAKLNRELTRTLRRSAVRYSISDAMSEAFRERYGVDFETLVSPVDVGEWLVEKPGDGQADGEKTVLYAGTIFEVAQLSGLIDISQAVARLNDAGVACRLVISTPAKFIDQFEDRFRRPGTTMVPHRGRDDVMAHMAGADLLVLPVEFDPKKGSFVRYSMPAKIVAYMASGIPVFVYGPNHAPPVAEARRYGFAHVLDRRDPDNLDAALRRLLIDKEYRAGLAEKAVVHARENHDIQAISNRFRSRLRSAAARPD